MRILITVVFLLWLAFALIDFVRRRYLAWRNERQVRAEMLMWHGFKSAGRRGWVSTGDDTQ